MMLLSVDTSCNVASAALFSDGVCLGEQFADENRRHAETVLPLIETLLERAGVDKKNIDLLAVDVGPGSFTGVRIGVSVVNAMADALQKPVVAVDALRTLAQSCVADDLAVCAFLDAGNGNCYAAQYRMGKVLAPPEAAVTEDYFSKLPKGTAVIGDSAEHPLKPSAKLVGAAAWSLRETACKAAIPVYLRPSQAERMWKLRQEAKNNGR